MAEQEFDPPAWLVAAVDQRVAQFEEVQARAGVLGYDSIHCALTDPPADATPRQLKDWETSCDNCQVYVPPASQLPFYLGHITRMTRIGLPIVITFGACAHCLEIGDAP